MNVGIWIRVSTEDQARGESPKNHDKRARMYAELKNWKVVEFYDLSGVSGKSVIDHPEAQRMLRDVNSGRIKALIFSKLARLARNTRELLEIADHFQKHTANLVSLEESIDTSNPAGRLLFTVIGALAQWEREEISARVSASIPIRAAQGKPTGGQGPYGYMWNEDKKLVINPKESPIIKELFNTFIDTKKLLTTAKLMNEKGYRTRKGARFGKTSVKRILTDPTYKGTKRANYSKSKGNKKAWEMKPKEQWVYFQVEPIIDDKIWNEVNALISKNASPYPSGPPLIGKYAFSGLITCGACNKKMYVMKYEGMKIPRYSCRDCKTKINEDVLFDQFKEGLKCMVVTPEQLQETVKNNGNVIKEKEGQLRALRTELKTVDRKIDNLLDLLNDETLDRKTFQSNIRSVQERKEQIEAEIPRLEGELDFIRTSELGKDSLLTKATSIYAMWDKIDYDNQVKITKELLSGITVQQNELIYEYFHLPQFR